jgi:hypothetical protein
MKLPLYELKLNSLPSVDSYFNTGAVPAETAIMLWPGIYSGYRMGSLYASLLGEGLQPPVSSLINLAISER